MKNAQSKKSFSGWLPASLWLIPFLLIPFQAHGSIIPIDLKAFFADYSVTVATDGRSAVMEEIPGSHRCCFPMILILEPPASTCPTTCSGLASPIPSPGRRQLRQFLRQGFQRRYRGHPCRLSLSHRVFKCRDDPLGPLRDRPRDLPAGTGIPAQLVFGGLVIRLRCDDQQSPPVDRTGSRTGHPHPPWFRVGRVIGSHERDVSLRFSVEHHGDSRKEGP